MGCSRVRSVCNDVARYHASARFGEQPPHVFAVAEAAYRAMVAADDALMMDSGGVTAGESVQRQCDQSILVSGESGAGKTESVRDKAMMLWPCAAAAACLCSLHQRSPTPAAAMGSSVCVGGGGRGTRDGDHGVRALCTRRPS
jgi:hypothetical protein